MNKIKKITYFNQKFVSANTETIIEYIFGYLWTKPYVKIIGALNTHLITLCNESQAMSDFYNNKCALVTVDGRPLVYLSYYLTDHPFPEMVGGPNLWNKIIENGVKFNKSFYLIGSTTILLNEAIRLLSSKYKTINILGWNDGYFEIGSDVFKKIVSELKNSKPDFIFIGISSPLKEKLAIELANQLQHGFIVLVGGYIDHLSGGKKIGNELTSKLCLDWVLRIFQEPRRLFWRYTKSNIIFSKLLVTELFKKYIVVNK